MRTWVVVAFCWLSFACRTQPAPPHDRYHGATLELPVLRAHPLPTKDELASHEPEPESITWRWERPGKPPRRAPRFASNLEVEDATREWLRDRFGDRAAIEVRCDAYNSRAFWQQQYQGVDTDVSGMVMFIGQEAARAHGRPAQLCAVAGSLREVITAEQATAAWQRVARNFGVPLHEFATMNATQLHDAPSLMFVESPTDRLLHPTWIVGSRRLAVDAHTGQPWLGSATHTFAKETIEPLPPIEQLATGPRLSLLNVTARLPIADAASFQVAFGTCDFVKLLPDDAHQEAAHETPGQRVAAARAWIVDHFGAMPDNVELVAVEAVLDANDTAFGPLRENVHRVRLGQTHDGRRTDRFAELHFVGKRVQTAIVRLATFTPKPDSGRPTLTRQAAMDIYLRDLACRDADEATLQAVRQRLDPHLEYVWSSPQPWHGHGVLAPTWVMGPGVTIDAITGRIRREN